MSSYRCPFCETETAGEVPSACPGCGSAIDVRKVAGQPTSWVEMPAIRNMSRFQFGQSTCQVEGAYVPVTDVKLAAEDHVYFNHHVVLWMDGTIKMETMPLNGAWKRMLAGMPVVMAQAHGPGHIGFSLDAPGETIALPLHPGQAVDVREGVFLLATGQTRYDFFDPGIWYRTEHEMRYPAGRFMDKFSGADKPGLVFLHAGGNVFVRHLKSGEACLVKPTALVYKDTTVDMQLYIEHPRNYNQIWTRRYVWLILRGPGRVAVQSAYPRWEDPPEPVASSSYPTEIIDW